MATKREIEIARYFCELLSDANPPDSWYERELSCISRNIEEEIKEFEEWFNDEGYAGFYYVVAWSAWKAARGIE